jgi:hypothetical protein
VPGWFHCSAQLPPHSGYSVDSPTAPQLKWVVIFGLFRSITCDRNASRLSQYILDSRTRHLRKDVRNLVDHPIDLKMLELTVLRRDYNRFLDGTKEFARWRINETDKLFGKFTKVRGSKMWKPKSLIPTKFSGLITTQKFVVILAKFYAQNKPARRCRLRT